MLKPMMILILSQKWHSPSKCTFWTKSPIGGVKVGKTKFKPLIYGISDRGLNFWQRFVFTHIFCVFIFSTFLIVGLINNGENLYNDKPVSTKSNPYQYQGEHKLRLKFAYLVLPNFTPPPPIGERGSKKGQKCIFGRKMDSTIGFRIF